MNPEEKKDVPEDNPPPAEPKMSLHDRVVFGLALMVAPGLCILLGTVLRVPGN